MELKILACILRGEVKEARRLLSKMTDAELSAFHDALEVLDAICAEVVNKRRPRKSDTSGFLIRM